MDRKEFADKILSVVKGICDERFTIETSAWNEKDALMGLHAYNIDIRREDLIVSVIHSPRIGYNNELSVSCYPKFTLLSGSLGSILNDVATFVKKRVELFK